MTIIEAYTIECIYQRKPMKLFPKALQHDKKLSSASVEQKLVVSPWYSVINSASVIMLKNSRKY